MPHGGHQLITFPTPRRPPTQSDARPGRSYSDGHPGAGEGLIEVPCPLHGNAFLSVPAIASPSGRLATVGLSFRNSSKALMT